MFPEPAVKRAFAFVDSQNLFNCAKEAFEYDFPNFDPIKLAQSICRIQSWQFVRLHIYTGLPDNTDKRREFWNKKLQILGTRGAVPFTRPLRYRDRTVMLPNGSLGTARVGTEKGIDVRIALDVVRYALDGSYDVALIFSQDQDLSEAADELRRISQQQGRWIMCASAYPVGPGTTNNRGLRGTKHIKIDKALYDHCIDPNDYRSPRS